MKTTPNPNPNTWTVAGLQFVNPMGTWRMACLHANTGRYAHVQFRPVTAREAYRANPA